MSDSDKVWVMVETISQFRIRYMVETDRDHPEHALDVVTMEEAREFSQLHLGETIVSHRVVTEDEALAQARVDNDYLTSWSDEQFKRAMFTPVGWKPQDDE